MKFKKWLLNEEGGDIGNNDDGWDWDLIYPSTAGDYVYDIDNPKWFWWLQWRWRRGEEIGRPLYNIDNDIFNWGYVSPYSTSLPAAEAESGFWQHKEDKGKSSIGVAKANDLVRIGVSEKPGETEILYGPRISHSMGTEPGKPKTDLSKIFGDNPKPINRLDNPNY